MRKNGTKRNFIKTSWEICQHVFQKALGFMKNAFYLGEKAYDSKLPKHSWAQTTFPSNQTYGYHTSGITLDS